MTIITRRDVLEGTATMIAAAPSTVLQGANLASLPHLIRNPEFDFAHARFVEARRALRAVLVGDDDDPEQHQTEVDTVVEEAWETFDDFMAIPPATAAELCAKLAAYRVQELPHVEHDEVLEGLLDDVEAFIARVA